MMTTRYHNHYSRSLPNIIVSLEDEMNNKAIMEKFNVRSTLSQDIILTQSDIKQIEERIFFNSSPRKVKIEEQQSSHEENQLKMSLHRSFQVVVDSKRERLQAVNEHPTIVTDSESDNDEEEQQQSHGEQQVPVVRRQSNTPRGGKKRGSRTRLLRDESSNEELEIDTENFLSSDTYLSKSSESKIDCLNALLDQQSKEIQLLEMRLEDAQMDTRNLRDSICQLHLQEGRMKDKMDMMESTEIKDAKNEEDKLRMKICDYTRIRDKSISSQTNRIDKVLSKIRSLKDNNASLNQRYEEIEQKEFDIDLQLKNTLQEIEQLKSNMETGELMKAKFINFLSDVYNKQCVP